MVKWMGYGFESASLEVCFQKSSRAYVFCQCPTLWPNPSSSMLQENEFHKLADSSKTRILYNINGFGVWEKSLCKGACTSTSDGDTKDSTQFDAEKLLQKLHAIYDQIDLNYEYSRDLVSYLQYCKDVVFAVLEPSYENYEEERSIEHL
ncbi:hypothetical protein SAY87_017575 [Trapa incisa]|uniref:Uncharacterized protein n=1 Tax=Trapa incisa TaxID=236973 RepID=A0AAN7KW13_9MYRT|nr:hypothetical protein SAY87_017575 [Trapa incisa]